MRTLHDDRYKAMIKYLVKVRKNRNITQKELAEKTNLDRTFVTKVETYVRAIGILDLLLWLDALDISASEFFSKDWINKK